MGATTAGYEGTIRADRGDFRSLGYGGHEAPWAVPVAFLCGALVTVVAEFIGYPLTSRDAVRS